MKTENERLTTYNYGNPLHPPTDNEDAMLDTGTHYQQIVGDFCYLADSTRPDLSFIAGSLGCAMHKPTDRH